MAIKSFIIIILLILAYHAAPITALDRARTQYKYFFPAWSDFISTYLNSTCHKDWDNYNNSTYGDQGVSYNVLDCLLRQFPEFRKAELAASAVVLGLAPTILQMLSPSAADTALLAHRRPILALLMSASTVVVTPARAVDFVEGVDKLMKPLPEGVSARFPFTLMKSRGNSWWTPVFVSAMEYLVAGAAAANSAYRTYQLCVWAVCVFVPQYDFLPALWHGGSLAIHLFGWITMYVLTKSPSTSGYENRFKVWICSELRPSAWGDKMPLKKREGYLFYVMDMVLHIAVPVQILYGTMVLSSLVFLSVLDAVVMVTWYVLSAVACHGILMYECAGMREVNQAKKRPDAVELVSYF